MLQSPVRRSKCRCRNRRSLSTQIVANLAIMHRPCLVERKRSDIGRRATVRSAVIRLSTCSHRENPPNSSPIVTTDNQTSSASCSRSCDLRSFAARSAKRFVSTRSRTKVLTARVRGRFDVVPPTRSTSGSSGGPLVIKDRSRFFIGLLCSMPNPRARASTAAASRDLFSAAARSRSARSTSSGKFSMVSVILVFYIPQGICPSKLAESQCVHPCTVCTQCYPPARPNWL